MSTNDWRSAGHEFEIFLDLSVVQAASRSAFQCVSTAHFSASLLTIPKIQSGSPLGPPTNPSPLTTILSMSLPIVNSFASEKLSFIDVGVERLTRRSSATALGARLRFS
jgi:hypothetical protein